MGLPHKMALLSRYFHSETAMKIRTSTKCKVKQTMIKRTVIICLALSAISAPSVSFADDYFDVTADHKAVLIFNLPNLDQKRKAGSVLIKGVRKPLLGLPADGISHCGPASMVEWAALLANRGYPKLLPGPSPILGSYPDGFDGLDQYNRVTLAMGIMGANMHTNVDTGTPAYFAQVGSQQFFDAAYYGNFCTVYLKRSKTDAARMIDLVDAELNGNLIATLGGWMVSTTYKDQTVYYRNGGHFAAMAGGYMKLSDLTGRISLANPGSGDALDVQSPQLYNQHLTEPATLTFVDVDDTQTVVDGSSVTAKVDWLDKSLSWVLDGALSLQNFNIYSIRTSTVVSLDPNHILNTPGYIDGVKNLTHLDGPNVISATRNPLTGTLYYLTQHPYATLNKVDPYTGDPSPILSWTDSHPRQIMFGASFKPFALWGDANVSRMDLTNGAYSDTVNIGMYVDRLAFDYVHNQIAAINLTSGAYRFLDRNLSIKGPLQHFVIPSGFGPIFTEFGPKGHLFVFQEGDTFVRENIPTTNGNLLSTEHFEPAAVGADGFTVDDWGRQYFSLNGIIQVMDSFGRSLASPLNGLPGGSTLLANHSMNNDDPKAYPLPAWRDTIPPGVFGTPLVKSP